MEETCLQLTSLLATTSFESAPPKQPDRWKELLPMIRKDLQEYGIDNDPKFFDAIVAKIVTGEVRDGKGFLFMGTTGSGKTKRAKFICDMIGIHFYKAESIGPKWIMGEGDDDYLQEYMRSSKPRWSELPHHYGDIFIDDLGVEDESYSVYGNTTDVMRKVLRWRYDVFTMPELRWKTYITTNLDEASLKQRYGERIASRLNEMCVFLSLKHPDRRQKT